MISVRFLTTDSGELLGFSLSGHAGYGEAEEDIVCAAVSSAAYLTANTVTEILHADAQVSAEDGEMYVRVSRSSAADCRSIFAGFKLHMIGLEEQYSENFRVSYLEV